jgi:drug/metabolite transporter (DMT)-like permease
VEPAIRRRAVAAALALLAAFLWATYYLFVLAVTPGTRPSAVLFYPFAGGALAYAVWAASRGQLARVARGFREGPAYERLALLLGMQASVLAATYLIGPVDASLLSLLGDVVATPLVVAVLVARHRPELRTPAFVVGLLLSLAGGTLAIVGGHGVASVRSVGWVVVVAAPVCVALFFVLSARAGTVSPISAVLAQSMIAAAAGTLVLAPLVPGGVAGIARVGAWPLALLLINGVVSFCVAQICYFRAIELAGLVLPPMLMTGIPVFTLLLSAFVLGIAPASLALLGVPVAAAGGIVALGAGARASRSEGNGTDRGDVTGNR